jgi:mono/diheme cytochrome c family protein
MAQGKSIYNKFCLVCHQADGSGVAGLYPPIVNTDWVQGDKERLIKVIINGQEGPIEVNGESYNNIMPAQDFLKNEEIAAVLTYIRKNFENNASAVTTEEVEQVRATL